MMDNLDEVLADVKAHLHNAATSRKSAMHTPVVGTADGDLRVMVLRDFNGETNTLRFHTDARSPKVAAIETDGAASVLFYDPAAKVQIRTKGTARVERDGPIADAAWAAADNFARRCYLAVDAPGAESSQPTSGLPPQFEGVEPDDGEVAAARVNFAVVLVEVQQLDWLYLAHTGHRRAMFEDGVGRWVVP